MALGAGLDSVSKAHGSFASAVNFGVGEQPVSVAIADIDGDGLPDLAVANHFGDDVSVLLNREARISKLTVTGPATLRKGRTATFRAKITNSGNAKLTGVRLVATGKGIRLNVPAGTINAGATRTVNLRINPSRTGRINATFKVVSADAGSKVVRKTVRVR
jgi:hypothetical protein